MSIKDILFEVHTGSLPSDSTSTLPWNYFFSTILQKLRFWQNAKGKWVLIFIKIWSHQRSTLTSKRDVCVNALVHTFPPCLPDPLISGPALSSIRWGDLAPVHMSFIFPREQCASCHMFFSWKGKMHRHQIKICSTPEDLGWSETVATCTLSCWPKQKTWLNPQLKGYWCDLFHSDFLATVTHIHPTYKIRSFPPQDMVPQISIQ